MSENARVAIDVGGTFTDVVTFKSKAEEKKFSSPAK
jgi:N-methylhydantoinase A/oxoprolinase/acetone carboxylase beta subunit